MVSRQRLEAKKSQYEDLMILADHLATEIEACWLGSWLDAPWEWGAESQRAVQAASDACRHLIRIHDLLTAMPVDLD